MTDSQKLNLSVKNTTTTMSDFFDCNYFTLFGLPKTLAIDNSALRAKYLQLQVVAHPDGFAGAGVMISKLPCK